MESLSKQGLDRRALVLGAGAWLGAASVVRAQAPAAWTLAPGYGADVFMTQNLQEFARLLTAASQGKLSVTVAELGKPYAMADIRGATGEQKIAGGQVLASTLSAEFPAAGADSVPFITGSYEDAARLWKFQRPVLEKQLAAKGLKLLYAMPWPPQGLYASKPIQSLEDMRGLRMRTYNPTTERIAELMGATPVNLPHGSALLEALAQGTIDAMMTSSATGVEMQAWQRFKYFYDVRAWLPKTMTFVNAQLFEALEPATREAVLGAAQQAEELGWKASEAEVARALVELRRHQMEVALTPPQLVRPLHRFGERFALEWIKTVGNDANQIFVPYYAVR